MHLKQYTSLILNDNAFLFDNNWLLILTAISSLAPFSKSRVMHVGSVVYTYCIYELVSYKRAFLQ